MARTPLPSVIYEDSELLVINKPAGMTVNRAETVREETLQDWVERKLRKVQEVQKVQEVREVRKVSKVTKVQKGKASDQEVEVFRKRSGVVHRLDKDTSGVLVVAKTPEIFIELQRQFKERKVEKEYVALVHGDFIPREGTVRLPIARSVRDRHLFRVDSRGKVAETNWVVEGRYHRENFGEVLTLLRLKPTTGRTHQLRVHLGHLGHPVVGDQRYLSKKRAHDDAIFCSRQFLHAEKLCVWRWGKRKCFVAPLAADLQMVLTHLIKVQE